MEVYSFSDFHTDVKGVHKCRYIYSQNLDPKCPWCRPKVNLVKVPKMSVYIAKDQILIFSFYELKVRNEYNYIVCM